MTGKRLSHYDIVEEFSRGGMGIVRRADGKAVLFTNRTGEIVEAELDLENGSVGTVTIVSTTPSTRFGFFDLHPDGSRILVPANAVRSSTRAGGPIEPILDVLVNWTGTLPERQE